MKRELRVTSDGSRTLFVASLDEHYHSIHGAFTESLHVFVNAGLKQMNTDEISILEIGFGTGLNALVTLAAVRESGKKIQYTGVEAYPVHAEEWNALEYTCIEELVSFKKDFHRIHECPWESIQQITANFSLIKQQKKFAEIDDEEKYDLVYFDAFAPSAQPDLWTVEIFNRMYRSLKPSGLLVTYCAKGQVKRNMKAAGFAVERLPGPPGKREMTRAIKLP